MTYLKDSSKIIFSFNRCHILSVAHADHAPILSTLHWYITSIWACSAT